MEEQKQIVHNEQNQTGLVYTWGLGKEGQLGYGGQENQQVPVQVKGQCNNIIDVQAGGQFSAYLTQDGKVYFFGSNKKSQLGLAKQEDQIIPQQIQNLKNIVKISLGDWHSLALDNQGICYGTGYNKKGCLGIKNNPQTEQFIKMPYDQQIIDIKAGRNVSLFIDTNLQIISCGIKTLNGHNTDDIFSIQKIKSLENEKIINISAGFACCAAITQEGDIYTWGEGSDYNLGHGDNKDQLTPKKIQFFEKNLIKLKQVSCTRSNKYMHMGAITQENQIYTWGSGYKAKLGHGKNSNSKDEGGYDNIKIPKLVKFFNNENKDNQYIPKEFISGGIHSAVLTENGQLLTFGCGSDGRLGHPDMKNAKYLYKEAFPKSVEDFNGKRVLKASSSYYHMIALVQ